MTAAGGGRAARRRHGVRLTRRGRVVVVAVMATAMLAGSWLGARHAVAGGGVEERGAHRTVTVRQGDTLWGIATRHAPYADPRVTVHRIVELNGLPGPTIQVGERLALPDPG